MEAEPLDGASKKDDDTRKREHGTYAGVLKRIGAGDRSWVEEIEREEGWTRADRRERTAGGAGVQRPRGTVAEGGEEDRDREWQQEMKRRRKREKRVIFKKENLDANRVDKEKAEKWLEIELKRKVEVKDLRREGEDMIVVRLKRVEDARELVQRRIEIGERWEMWLDRDRTFRERKSRWTVKERAKEERRMGKKVIEEEGRICVNGTWWVWKEKEEDWGEENRNNRRQRLVRWRLNLEERMGELKKEEKELEKEKREVQAEDEAERRAKGGNGTAEVDTAENGNTDVEKEVDTEEKENAEVDREVDTEGKEHTEVEKEVDTAENENTEGAVEVEKAVNGEEKASEKSERTQDRGVQVEGKRETKERRKGAQTNKGQRRGRDQEDENGHGREKEERRRERVKKWRKDLERRKAEMKKELEELEAEEAEEAKELAAEGMSRKGGGNEEERERERKSEAGKSDILGKRQE